MIIVTFWDGIRKWKKKEQLEAAIRIMAGISVGYLSIFLPIIMYFWTLENYSESLFLKISFILFIANTLMLGVLVVLSLLKYIEGNTNIEQWNGD
jgi:hypothetical protein